MYRIVLQLFVICAVLYGSNASGAVLSDVNTNGHVTITGSGFGEKSTPQARYFSDMEGMPVGQIPQGWYTLAGAPAVSLTKAFSGTQAVEFISDSDDFHQIAFDAGEFPSIFVFHGKMYIDNTADTLTQYQLKHIRLSSSEDVYRTNAEITTSIVLYDSWWTSDGGDRWFNTGSPHVYYDGSNSYAGSVSAPSDLFPMNTWFDYKVILRRSSAPGTPDGAVYNYVNGELKSSKTDFTTHDADDGVWRYFMLGGSIVSGSGGVENMRIYYDDVYLDDTLSCVEIGDKSTYEECLALNPQPVIAWSDTSVDVNLNKGALVTGSTAYMYITDSSGVVSDQDMEEAGTQGFAFTITEPSALSLTVIQASQTVTNTTTSFTATGTTTNATSVTCDPVRPNTGTVDAFTFADIPLSVGDNVITVTASDGVDDVLRSITITREQSVAPETSFKGAILRGVTIP